MSQQAHYFKIGLFVVGATALAVAGTIVFGAHKWFEKSTMVETYFMESVQGLELGAPVRLRGVRVGRVESIRLAREEYGIIINPQTGIFPYRGVVVVRMSVRPSVAAHIKEEDEQMVMKMAADAGFRFRLASQGITGVLYIESDFLDPERYPPMEIAWTPKTPYIPSAPSTITELGADLRSITRKLEQVDIDKITKDLDTMFTSITRLVNDVQEKQLGTEVKQVMGELHGTIEDVRHILRKPELNKALKDSAVAMQDIRRTAADAREAMTQLPEILARMNKSLRRIDALVDAKGETIDELLENLRSVSEELNYLTKSVERYPSQVLFGEPPTRSNMVKR
jgi:phospholipid/cholesterol/gamma-HCH transport system substrate-binding protein